MVIMVLWVNEFMCYYDISVEYSVICLLMIIRLYDSPIISVIMVIGVLRVLMGD
jgi:hypothetical protein